MQLRCLMMRRSRWARVILMASVAVAVLAGSAGAATNAYWGYNYLTASNPPAGTCPTFGAGKACSGWNYWDYSQMDRNSGSAFVGIGFIYTSDRDRIHYAPIPFDPGVYTVVWNDFRLPEPYSHYNKAACVYVSGTYVYAQCRALIF